MASKKGKLSKADSRESKSSLLSSSPAKNKLKGTDSQNSIPRINLEQEEPETYDEDARRAAEAQLTLDEQNMQLERAIEASRKKNDALEAELNDLLNEGSPQVIELKQEVVRLTQELLSIKQKNFQDLQLLATTMAARNVEYNADLQRLQAEYQNLAPLSPNSDNSAESPGQQKKEQPTRTRSTSFAQKVKGLFSSSKKDKKKDGEDSSNRERDED